MTDPNPDFRRLQLNAILSEYNALYKLAEYRLNALDRRIPAISGLLAAFMGSVPVLPEESQLLALIAVPVSLIWLVRTTTNHARSFEDALRAIEWHEHQMNALLGRDVIGFQSRHPSKGRSVGGRTGTESVYAVSTAACLILALSAYIAYSHIGIVGYPLLAYALFFLLVFGLVVRTIQVWRIYRFPADTHKTER
ncbi:MAG: hypothetical protein KC996_04770 [Phycisphaerales bacterium]|nr:hypothetical protein [Phycisphaerales bacterium]